MLKANSLVILHSSRRHDIHFIIKQVFFIFSGISILSRFSCTMYLSFVFWSLVRRHDIRCIIRQISFFIFGPLIRRHDNHVIIEPPFLLHLSLLSIYLFLSDF